LTLAVARNFPGESALLFPERYNIQQIVEALEPGTLLLLYLPMARETLIFALSVESSKKYSCDVTRVNINEQAIRDELETLREYIFSGTTSADPITTWIEKTSFFQNNFVSPVEKEISKSRRLLIVPVNCMNAVPFGALGWRDGKNVTCLNDVKPVQIVPSIQAWAILNKRNRTNPAAGKFTRFVSFREPLSPLTPENDAMDIATLYFGLPSGIQSTSQFEDEELQRLFKLTPSKDIQHYRKVKADETAIKNAYNDAVLCHLDCPAVIENVGNFQSCFLFTPPLLTGTPEDGKLYRDEILRELSFKKGASVLMTSLDVMNARFFDHSGLWFLYNSLMLVGADRLFVCLWPARKEVNQLYFEEILNQLQRGNPPPVCHQRAIQKVRNRKEYADPRHWAGLIYVGSN